MGAAYVPMDEALARVVIDLSGRPYAVISADFKTPSWAKCRPTWSYTRWKRSPPMAK